MKRAAELRGKIRALMDRAADLLEKARDGDTYDFDRAEVKALVGASTSADVVRQVQAWHKEAEEAAGELKALEDAARKAEMLARLVPGENDQVKGTATKRDASGVETSLSLGELFVRSEGYRTWSANRRDLVVPVEGWTVKALFSTTSGFAPPAVRTGLVVEAATRPIQVLQLIPTRPMGPGRNADVYMEETTRTHAAAERAEGGTYAESTFVFTEKSNPVANIGDSIPVTDEQLEDAPEVQALLDQRLRFGLLQRLDQQVLTGNGTSPNIRGILNVSGIQTQARGTDPAFDAIFKAIIGKVRTVGRAIVSGIVLHPTDWQNIRLTRTADGIYIMGAPFEPGPATLFGIPVVMSDVLTAGTGLVGDFTNFCYFAERAPAEVEIGWTGTQFTEGKRTLRARLRGAFTVTRPAAFCTVTGL